MKCTSYCGSPKGETHSPEEGKKIWCPVPHLQGILFHCHIDPGRWRVQIQMGGRGQSWFLFRCSDFQQLLPEGKH